MYVPAHFNCVGVWGAGKYSKDFWRISWKMSLPDKIMPVRPSDWGHLKEWKSLIFEKRTNKKHVLIQLKTCFCILLLNTLKLHALHGDYLTFLWSPSALHSRAARSRQTRVAHEPLKSWDRCVRARSRLFVLSTSNFRKTSKHFVCGVVSCTVVCLFWALVLLV